MKKTIFKKLMSSITIVFLIVCLISEVSIINAKADSAPDNNLQIRYFNITGDCTFMVIKSGTKTISILVDTGSGSNLLTKLKHPDVYNSLEYGTSTNNKDKKVIDYVFITHAHEDHTSGLINLLNSTDSTYKYIIRNLYYNNVVGSDDGNNNTLSALKTAINNSSGKYVNKYSVGTNYSTDGEGTNRVTGDVTGIKTINIDGTRFTATIFPAMQKFKNTNNCSMMIKFVYTPSTDSTKKTNFVFPGDLGKGVIKKFTDNPANTYFTGLKSKDNDLTYLKIPHHASRRVLGADVTNMDLNYYYYDDITTKTVANRFAVCDKYVLGNVILNNYQYLVDQDGWVSEIKNYDEEFNAIFRQGSGSKVYGIGNVKTVADTISYFALVGLDKYYDTAPTDTITGLLNSVSNKYNLLTDAKIPAVSSSAKTYQVNISYN